MSYLGEMNLDAGSQFSVSQLVAGAVGVTALGVLIAALLGALLHAALHAAGGFQARKGAEPKFSWLLAVLAVGLCAVIGGVTGLKVGVARAAVPVARDLGPKMVEEGLQKALRQAGMTNFPSLEVAKLREFLTKAESAELPPLEQLERFRPQIEEARAKLLPAARSLLEANAKDGRISLNDAVAKIWPPLFEELAAWEKRFRRATIVEGVVWVVAIELGLALICLAMRLLRDPLPAGPPKIPNR